MRTEAQSKLDSMARRQRLGRMVAVVLAVLIGAGIFFIQSQPNRSEREVEATVRVATVADDPNQRYIQTECELEGGRIVLATGLASMPPAQGARIVLRERVTWFGYRSYEWQGATK